jgi:hypothetical protein
MKRLIQIGSFLGLALIFSAVTANAQTVFGDEVNIPFSFSVGSHNYEAGKYIIRLNKIPSGSGIVTITDSKTDRVQAMLVRSNGESSDEMVKFVFDNISGERTLSRIIMPTGGFSLVGGRRQSRAVAGGKVGPTQTTTIAVGAF